MWRFWFEYLKIGTVCFSHLCVNGIGIIANNKFGKDKETFVQPELTYGGSGRRQTVTPFSSH